jgi:catechol 2,3-dioxygenase-like lactoylglutathione lyase family enzyme
MFKKVTPVLIVEAIEPVLPFWQALGFEQVVAVPHGDHIGFVILVRDGVEIMYQSIASVREDTPATLSGPRPLGAAAIYIEVDDFEAVVARVPKDAEVVVPRRVAPYGSTEIFVRDPAGNVIGFAQPAT